MFDGLKRLWGRIVSMFNYTTLKNIIGKDVALSQTMIDAINEWKRMLAGNADWCDDTVESLKLEEGICREFADSALVEMEAKILNNDKMDKVLQKGLSDINKKLQTGLALGAMVLRPLGPDKAEYVAADKFIPISFDDSGVPNDIAFLVVKSVGENDYYTRVERHYFTNGNLTIENKCYHSQSRSDIGQRCNLEEVAEWANLQPGPIIYIGMTEMDFGYYQNPIENKVDGSSCGVSVYALGDVTLDYETKKCDYDRGRMFTVDAMDNIESAGIAFGRLSGEFLRTQVVPELDTWRLAKYAGYASGNNVATGAIADGKAGIAAIRAGKTAIKNAEAKTETCYLFISTTLKGMIDDLDTTASKKAMEDWAGVIEVPASRFFDKVTLTKTGAGGFATTGGKAIDFLIVDKNAAIQYQKHTVSKIITPEQNQTADAWKFGYRTVGIAEAQDNKKVAIYVHKVGE